MGKDDLHKAIIENSPIAYSYSRIIYDDKGDPKDYEFMEVNKAYEAMVGIEIRELVGKKFSQIYDATKKEGSSWEALHKKIFKNYKKEEFDYYFDFMDKNYRIKIDIPKKHYITIYFTDISREISETEKLKMLSDNVPIQVWYLKDENTYVSANKAHADFIGFKKEDLVFKNIKDLFSQEESSICIAGNKNVFREKKKIVNKSWLHNYKDEKRLLRITKIPKFNSKGQIEFVICSAEDITKEYTSKEQSEIKERILYSTMEFTQELLTNTNHYQALANGIEMLGNATQVDRVYYWENHFDQDSKKWLTNQIYEWCLGDVTQHIENPELQNIPFEEVGDFIGILSQNKTFSSHIKDMDGENSSTKEILELQGILSILVLPVFIKDEFRGFIGFDSCNFEKEWSEVEISLLNSFVLLYQKALEKNLLEESVLQVKDNFYNFFNMVEDLLFVLDFEGNIIDINNNVLKKLKYSRKELIGQPVLMLHPKDKLQSVKKNIEDLIMKKIEYCNIESITKDGHILPVETRVSEGLWDGEPALFAVSKDISQLSMSEEKFSKAFNYSGVSKFISRFEDGQILEVNDTFLDYIGYSREEVLGKTTLDLEMFSKFENRKRLKKEIRDNGKILGMEIEIINKDKTLRRGLTNMVALNINNEKCLLSSIVDITSRYKYEQKLVEISNRDSLTGTYNRRCTYDRGKEIVEEYKRNGKLFSVAIIDIDNFKAINDKYGHQVGDHVLIEFTKVINDNLRLYDILGRYGGEEFIIILNHSNKEESKIVLERILDIVRKKNFILDDKKMNLTFSAGIASCQELAEGQMEIDQLVNLADKRMYIAKNNGKDRIVYEGIAQ